MKENTKETQGLTARELLEHLKWKSADNRTDVKLILQWSLAIILIAILLFVILLFTGNVPHLVSETCTRITTSGSVFS